MPKLFVTVGQQFLRASPARYWRGLVAALLLALAASGGARADEVTRANILEALCASGVEERIGGIEALLASIESRSEEPGWGIAILSAAGNRTLVCTGDAALLVGKDGNRDALTLEPSAREPGKKSGQFVNLKLRAYLDMGVAILRLLDEPGGPNAQKDLAELQKRAKTAPAGLVELAAGDPGNAAVAQGLQGILAIAALEDPDPVRRVAAIHRLAEASSERNLTLLLNLRAQLEQNADDQVATALSSSIRQIQFWLRVSDVGAVVYSGLSYASILFLAAIGLAVIFGLMGVINLAQGELIMIGAYTTFLVQEGLKASLPGLINYYPLIAIPFAFIVTAGIGLAMEATVIRHLYRRPLMTLLSTWAISLLLINLVRVGFGTQNLEFIVPSFLNGGVRVFADFIVTWNRLFAICFAAAVLVLALFALHYTKLGMFIRAVTENRDMAACVGVAVRRVDLVAFGIGSGLAGLAGLALSPIYTANPGMGASFIVDAFMIVVLGGVGSLIGTAVAALGIGMINVVIEPLYGAVAAKVIVLLLIIVFIQFRPEGLVAVRKRR